MEKSQPEKHKEKLSELLPLSDHKEFQKISCPACHQGIPAADINIHDKIAKCQSCDAVFSFQKEINSVLDRTSVRQEIVRPEGIDLFHFQGDLDITLSQPVSVAESLLGVLPLTFAFLFTMIYIGAPNAPIGLPIISWLITIPLLANLILRSKQKMHIVVDEKYLSIIRQPKKFKKNQYYAIEDIDQLYVKTANGKSILYMSVVGIKGQKNIALIPDLDSILKAKYIEQEIERHLGIENRSIPGEAM